MTSAGVERQAIETYAGQKGRCNPCRAVKLSPFYSAFAHLAQDSTVPGPMLWSSSTVSTNPTSPPRAADRHAHASPLRFLRVAPSPASGWLSSQGASGHRLAVTGGVRHTGLDVVKATMAGAHVTQMVSALLMHGRASPNGAGRSQGVDAGAGSGTRPPRCGATGLFKVPDPDANRTGELHAHATELARRPDLHARRSIDSSESTIRFQLALFWSTTLSFPVSIPRK